jgi:hypothetical protein
MGVGFPRHGCRGFLDVGAIVSRAGLFAFLFFLFALRGFRDGVITRTAHDFLKDSLLSRVQPPSCLAYGPWRLPGCLYGTFRGCSARGDVRVY